MFDTTNIQVYWTRPYLGGPKAGQMQEIGFTSVPAPGYVYATWFDAAGNVIAEINQHESITTIEAFEKAVNEWVAMK